MASTAEVAIMEALFGRLGALVLNPVHTIAWPNVPFTPPGNQRYLRAQFVPNVANRLLISSDGPHQHLGLLQVSVYDTKGQGESRARETAGLVAAHFPADFKIHNAPVTVRVTKRPDVADLIVEDAAIQIPVMVAWECWA
jgi:hypothetical protein